MNEGCAIDHILNLVSRVRDEEIFRGSQIYIHRLSRYKNGRHSPTLR